MASADVDAHYRPYWQDSSALGPGSRGIQSPDDLDALFNEDGDIDDVSRNANADAGSRPAARSVGARTGDDGLGLGLGIDEEVKVRKPRAPVAKLDEERLLSAKGIPKLRRITKERLKFRGKGHEFSDVSRMLNTYQFWLDDLFPRAKFADGLAIIEKLGHKKRIQVMRREWIDEGKPKPASPDIPDADDEFVDPGAEGRPLDRTKTAEDVSMNETSATNEAPASGFGTRRDDMDDEDIYAEATPAPNTGNENDAERAERNRGDDAEPDLGELDALLAEDAEAAERQPTERQQDSGPIGREDYADDEEAMADMW